MIGRFTTIPAITCLSLAAPIFKSGVQSLWQSKRPNADTLSATAIMASLIASRDLSALIIILLAEFAEFLTAYSMDRTRRAIRSLLSVGEDNVWQMHDDGTLKKVPISEVAPDDFILVHTGEKISADGIVEDGEASVDQSSITGEFLPATKAKNDEVFAGTVVKNGTLTIRAQKVGDQTAVSRVIHLVEEAYHRKAAIQAYADRFSASFIPVNFALAIIVYFITKSPSRALNMLIIDYSCGVRLSTATALSASLAAAAREGVRHRTQRTALGATSIPSELADRFRVPYTSQRYKKRLLEGFGHFYLPIYWRDVEPAERQFNWQNTDEWINWFTEQRLPVRCGPLIGLSTRHLPDWIYLWGNDFEGIRDLMYEHVQRTVGRYGDRVAAWDVVSGINAENPFKFSFEQLIELTRVAALATKRLVPRCIATIELVQPWGEYRAKNMQTVPAAMFADMAVQSGVNFDALGVRLHFGIGRDGLFVRDFFQISSLLDEFASLGKPLRITGVEVPSNIKADPSDAWGGSLTTKTGGYWRRPWDDDLQAEWLQKFVQLAISKPFVESICWTDLSDAHPHNLPHSGLLRADYSPKPAYKVLLKLAKQYNGRTS